MMTRINLAGNKRVKRLDFEGGRSIGWSRRSVDQISERKGQSH